VGRKRFLRVNEAATVGMGIIPTAAKKIRSLLLKILEREAFASLATVQPSKRSIIFDSITSPDGNSHFSQPSFEFVVASRVS